MLNAQTPETKRYLNKQQVADMLGIGLKTIDAYMRHGLIPFLRITRRKIRFDAAAVQEHLTMRFTVNAKGVTL